MATTQQCEEANMFIAYEFVRLLKSGNVYMYDKTPFVTRSRS